MNTSHEAQFRLRRVASDCGACDFAGRVASESENCCKHCNLCAISVDEVYRSRVRPARMQVES